MKKKERIQYYNLIEPKLRKLFIDAGFVYPTEEEFSKFNINKKNREEFLNYYKDVWFAEEHFKGEARVKVDESTEEVLKLIDKDESKHILRTPNPHQPALNLPSTFALFQICRNIDTEEFYRCLEERITFIVVNKLTGMVTGGNRLNELSISLRNLMEEVKKNVNQYEIFEIEDHEYFCKLLEDGNFKAIKKAKLFQQEIYELPNDYPLARILKNINLYDFADILNQGKPLIKFDKLFGWYSSYEDVNDYHSFNAAYNKVIQIKDYTSLDRAKETDTIWFIAENPLKIRQEILYGNFKVLRSIKIIENIEQFFSQ